MRLQPKVRSLSNAEINAVAGGMHPVLICVYECDSSGNCVPTSCREWDHIHV